MIRSAAVVSFPENFRLGGPRIPNGIRRRSDRWLGRTFPGISVGKNSRGERIWQALRDPAKGEREREKISREIETPPDSGERETRRHFPRMQYTMRKECLAHRALKKDATRYRHAPVCPRVVYFASARYHISAYFARFELCCRTRAVFGILLRPCENLFTRNPTMNVPEFSGRDNSELLDTAWIIQLSSATPSQTRSSASIRVDAMSDAGKRRNSYSR